MIKFLDINKSIPYKLFCEYYNNALNNKQKALDAICISSYNVDSNEVDSRYVNLKYIKDSEWIFFSNYNSPKSQAFTKHKQIAAIIYWESINVQIRIKANLIKTDPSFSDEHFNNRSKEKNALAISSEQSSSINSFEQVERNYLDVLNSHNSFKRPDYWGGYSFTPFYFEFWEGHASRLNKRDAYHLNGNNWQHCFLQP